MISYFKRHGLAFLALAALLPVARAGTLFITPTFDSSITGNANASNIEGSINSAISAITALYSSPTAGSLTVDVTFTYNPASPGNLLSTNEAFYQATYANYVAALTADSLANPTNTALATAIANLGSGNDSTGSENIVMSGALYAALGLSPSHAPGDLDNATININSTQTFGYTQPVSGVFDLTGGLEHELDEVLGGGGAGSTLNSFANSGGCNPSNMNYNAFFCGVYGPLDLYRYTAASGGTASYNDTDPSAYFSINGDLSSIVAFNNVPSSGDMGDFAPACGSGSGTGQLIQNAQNCTGPDEAYTTSSPEFTMLESIGWDASSATPEPGTFALFGASIVTLAFLRRRFSRK